MKPNQDFLFSTNAESLVGFLVAFGLLSAITLPPISISGLGIYFVTISSPVVLIMSFLLFNHRPLVHLSAIYPLFLGSMVCLASLHSWVVGHSLVNYRDFVESIKYFQFLPYLLTLAFLGRRSLKIIHLFLILSALWVGFVGLVQISGVSHVLSYLYLGPGSFHIDSVITGSRLTLTGSDPNIGAVISCFFSIYFFSLFAVNKKRYYLVGFLFFFFLCFMTQSRTALVAVMFGLGCYYLFFYKSFFLVKCVFAFCSLSLVVFLIFYLDLSYIYIGFQYALEGKNNSLNVRLDNIAVAIQKFLESPIFGMGPAKSYYDKYIDSEYALIIQRYGLIGVALFLSYMTYLLRLAYRNLDSHWGVALFAFTLMSGVVMITNYIFSGYQLMSLVVILNIACVINERIKKGITMGATL